MEVLCVQYAASCLLKPASKYRNIPWTTAGASHRFGLHANGSAPEDPAWRRPEPELCMCNNAQRPPPFRRPGQSCPTKRHWHGTSITFSCGLRSHYLGTDQTALFNLQAASSVPRPGLAQQVLVHSISGGWHGSGMWLYLDACKSLQEAKFKLMPFPAHVLCNQNFGSLMICMNYTGFSRIVFAVNICFRQRRRKRRRHTDTSLFVQSVCASAGEICRLFQRWRSPQSGGETDVIFAIHRTHVTWHECKIQERSGKRTCGRSGVSEMWPQSGIGG